MSSVDTVNRTWLRDLIINNLAENYIFIDIRSFFCFYRSHIRGAINHTLPGMMNQLKEPTIERIQRLIVPVEKFETRDGKDIILMD